MRWGIAYSTALLSGVFTCSTAFLAPRRSSQGASVSVTDSIKSSSALGVRDLGWDNDNFLEALSQGPEALDKENQKYRRTSKYIPDDEPDPVDASSGGEDEGDGLTKEQIERIKKANENETAEGGQMFKRLMERAQQGDADKRPPQKAAPPPPPPPPPTPVAAAAPGTASGPALPAGFENMSIEAQAALFRELMKPVPAEAPVEQWPPAPGPRPPAKGQAAVADDGRRIGHNRDADAIVNTSDVYFAQLKRDSTVRNAARYNGDTELSEAVFQDPAIKEIKLHINPHMEEARRKEQEMIDTATDEMLTLQFLPEKHVNFNDKGASYKDKLLQMKGRKTGATASAPPKAVAEPVVAAAPEPVVAAAPEPVVIAAPEPVVVAAPEPVAIATPEPVAIATPEPVVVAPPVAVQAPPAPAAASTESTELKRGDIRTLMGLLLKHRGSPGFGSGRIQGAEIERFVTLASEMMKALRAEAQSAPQAPAAAPQAVAVQPAVTGGAISQAPGVPAGARIDSMIACIEGAVLMYKNSPPELQEGVLVTLRAALLSAVATLQPVAPAATGVGGAISQAPGVPVSARINSMIACIEGAVQMYKNSPSELQEGVLVMLRAALLSAVGTCNEILSASEVRNFEASGTAPSAMSSPTQFTDVVPEAPVQEMQSAPAQTSSYSGNDENSVFLESMYNKLKGAAGDGKMGLKKDLGAADAEDLANDISRMKALLVSELSSGIPEAPSGSSTPSKYQEMLAKARAEKEGKN